jgi:serine phosphatase RsbU (regulator of sigma subunit)
MALRTKSISFKVSLLYISLAVINISLFSVSVYENQIDLITENTKFKAYDLTNTILASLQKFAVELETDKIIQVKNKDDAVREISGLIGKSVSEYVIFTENGTLVYSSKKKRTITVSDVSSAKQAITNKDFMGKRFFTKIDTADHFIDFYVPLDFPFMKGDILLFRYYMKEISRSLNDLYFLISMVVLILAVFHVLFALMLYWLVIRRIKVLNEKSLRIKEGDLSARANIHSRDEIGSLADSFNSMASSIQEKITALERFNDIMTTELLLASEVQASIYPKFEKDDRFSFAVFHRPFAKVSGDYYDYVHITNDISGFIIADISGHGVPAALITMRVKELFDKNVAYFLNPTELFKHLNNEFSLSLSSHAAYFTSFYAIIDGDGYIRYSNAGHQTSLLMQYTDKKILGLQTNGLPIGISKELNSLYETKRTKINRGDKIVLYTDGLTEIKNPQKEEFGVNRLLDILRDSFYGSPEEIVETVKRRIREFTDIEKAHDDITLFVVELK